MLPDIVKKMSKLSQKPPIFGDIYTYKPIWVRRVPEEREFVQVPLDILLLTNDKSLECF